MLNRFFLLGAFKGLFVFLGFVALVFPLKGALSQYCEAPYETITRFEMPEPGAAMVWQSFYNLYGVIAEERQARFISSYGIDGGGYLVVGQVKLMKNVRPSLIFVSFDEKGRGEWEKIHTLPEMKKIVKVVRNGEESAVLVNMETKEGGRYFWIGFFDKTGELKSSQEVKEKGAEVWANDIHSEVDGSGWVLPVNVYRKWGGDSGQSQRNAAIYLLDRTGKKIGMRSYVLGVKSELLRVRDYSFEGERSGYIATGSYENDAGRSIAWVMRLNKDLSMVWQKEYGRGLSAKLIDAAVDSEGDVLVAGDVNSAKTNIQGAWLSKLDSEYGDVLWQRYYASKNDDFNYAVRNVIVHEDGRISFVLFGSVVGEKRYKDNSMRFGGGDFGHLLTLDKRGLTLSKDAFYAGHGADLSSVTMDKKGELVFVGGSLQRSYVDIKRRRKEHEKEVVPLSDEGEVHLPDVHLSDKAQQGLALLQKKISAQDVIHKKSRKKDAVDMKEKMINESAKTDDKIPPLLQKGWLFITKMDDAYKDPCEQEE